MKHVLVTGGAGFIGSHLVDRLLKEETWQVTVLDNFDPFYAAEIKEENVAKHRAQADYRLVRGDLLDPGVLASLPEQVDSIVHLAAKAGVRPSLQDPAGYQAVNVTGTQHLLEFARERAVKDFVFAGSSSVYGVNPDVPWREDDCVLRPISPYASTKVSGELLGHVYSHLYDLRFTSLRFFTVYGPRQRPDLAIHKFAKLIRDGEPLPVYGDGSSRRDYTYIGDIIEGVMAAVRLREPGFDIINLGYHRTVSLREMIGALEHALGTKAELEFLPTQPGDVPQTFADIRKAERLLGYKPTTSFKEGIERFCSWFLA